MSRRAPTAALALVAALGLGACTAQSNEDSSGDFRGEQRAVAEVVEDLQEAGSSKDGNEICTQLLTTSLSQAISKASGGSCADALEDALGDVDADELQVTKVQITGQTATATVKGEGGDEERTDTLTLRKERQGWRIAGLGS